MKPTKKTGAKQPAASSLSKKTHKLWTSFTFYGAQSKSKASWEDKLVKIASFDTIEGFWSVYNHIVRPAELPLFSELHLFKEEILPVWEDERNKDGGKFFFRIRKENCSRCFEDLILALIADADGFETDLLYSYLNGINIAVKPSDVTVSLWISDANDKELLERIRLDFIRVLQIPQESAVQFKQFF